MATGQLDITHLTVSQNNKEAQVNIGFDALDDAQNKVLTKAVIGDTTLSNDEFRGNGFVILTGSPGSAFTLNVPQGIERRITISNTTDEECTVVVFDAGTDAVTVGVGITALLHSDGDDIYQVSGSSGGGGGGSGGGGSGSTVTGIEPFRGFRATVSATQAISATTATDLTFGTEVFDTVSGFASDEFTVPAALDGKYMEFSAGVRFDASEDHELNIQVDDGGGFGTIAQSAVDSDGNSVATGPILVSTGDVIKAGVFCQTAATVENDARTFFSGHVVEAAVGSLPVAFKGFRAQRATSAQSLTSSTFNDLVFNSEDFDTESGYDAGTGEFTVPGSLDGKYMTFTCGVRMAASERLELYISIDRGSGVGNLAENTIYDFQGGEVSSGPILVSEGDIVNARIFPLSAASLSAVEQSFFSGYVIETSEDAFDYVEDTGASYTLTAADFKGNRTLELNNASAITLTLDTGIAAVGPLTVIQGGAGQITVSGTGTIESKSSADKSNGQHSAFTLIPTNTTDTYKMMGDITT